MEDKLKYNCQIRVPTKEPYAYIELNVEDTVENIKGIYDEFTAKFTGSTNHSKFYQYLTTLVDSNLKTWGDSNYYESLTDEQKMVAQSLKRYVKRIIK